ncbi:DUF4024 domain-containing protein [Bacillus sp. 123MFChir2]
MRFMQKNELLLTHS